jgi:general secretion pathway protein D
MKSFLIVLTLFFTPFVNAQQVTLNLKEVDITNLIQMVSEVTKKNFVVDERVKGKVTVVSSTPMNEKELYQAFLSILSVHGFTAIPSGKVIKILPETLGKSDNSHIERQDVGTDEIVTQVVEIKHVNAGQLIPALRPLVPQEGHLAASPDNNLIIISDRAANVERMVEIIKRIDKHEVSDIEVIRLRYASAVEIVRIINALEQQSRIGNPQISKPAALIADERTNSVLISGEKTEKLRLRTLVTHLDTPLESSGNTQVVYLKYAQAKELAEILRNVSDSLTGAKTPRSSPPTPTIVAAPITTPVPAQNQPANAPQTSTTPPSVAPVASPSSIAQTSSNPIGTHIQADPATNSLIITAAPAILQNLLAVVRQLDVRRAQVLVEAIIAEVENNKAQQLGVQWITEGLSGNVGPVGLINFGSPSSGIVDVASAIYNKQTPSTTNLNGITAGIGRYNVGGSFNFAVLLQALAADRSTNVLSTPSLVTLDNQEAQIHVGQNVPFVTGQYTNTGSTTGVTNPFQTIQRQDVGIKLKVKPQINEGNSIKLDIEQEVSSLVTDKVGTADVVTNTRSLKTSVMVEDSNVLVLGGLIDETLTDNQQKVPLLGDIPILGTLFRSQGTQKVKRNLMVFLHPKIMRNAETEQKISSSKYNYMRAQQLAHQAGDVPFVDKQEIPVLPDLNAFIVDWPQVK